MEAIVKNYCIFLVRIYLFFATIWAYLWLFIFTVIGAGVIGLIIFFIGKAIIKSFF